FWGTSGPQETDARGFFERLGLSTRAAPLLESPSGESRRGEERASNLSMGERQILSFARAFASEPRIWILDEATANMDSGTAALLLRSLETPAHGKTPLLIAHRLATVRTADRILVLHRGALIEQGTHKELMSLNG